MEDIAIYGAGGLGREVACVIKAINKENSKWNLIGFFDDGKSIGTENKYGKVLGGKNELNKYSKNLAVVVAVGEPLTLKKIVSSITNPLISFPNILSPDLKFLDESTFEMGKGNVFLLDCNVSCNVKIGDFNIFNGNIPIGHDVVMGSFNDIMPSVNISGEVVIGNCNFFGVQSIILQQVTIGNTIRLGSNSVLMKNAKESALYFGNPAIKIDY